MAKKAKAQAEIDINAVKDGAQGYTFRSRGEHVHYPSSQYRWDGQHRDWVTRIVDGKVEAYQAKKLGLVPNGTYVTNTNWWERNDELLQKVSVDSLVGSIKPAKIRGSHIAITSSAQSLSLARALSGGANPDNHPTDIDTIYIYSAVVAGGGFVPITLPNPTTWLYRTLRVYRATYMEGFCGVGALAALDVYHGTSTTESSARRIISSGTVNIGSRQADNWKYASSNREVATYHLERDSTAGVNHAAVDSTQCSGTMEIYELIGILDPAGNPAWLHTNVSELTAKIGKGDWDTLTSSLTAIEDLAYDSHDWINSIGTAKHSPLLSALVIAGTYTTANSYIIDGQYGYIEWEGNSGRNGIGLADSLPVGFTCEVQNNSSQYNLAISGTVLTNISYVPMRTIVRIRKLQSGLLVTLVASLSATVTSKI